jgi:hypothetical protein
VIAAQNVRKNEEGTNPNPKGQNEPKALRSLAQTLGPTEGPERDGYDWKEGTKHPSGDEVAGGQQRNLPLRIDDTGQMVFQPTGWKNREAVPDPGVREDQEALFPHHSEMKNVPGDSRGMEKLDVEKFLLRDPLQRSLEKIFSKDQPFFIKQTSPSSMEIVLEPAGLGKLDIELNLTQDRLQGQIMVNDVAGKEMIEKNLPLLLSDLAREGLQIGGFTVSLKSRGREQYLREEPVESKEPGTRMSGPEGIRVGRGNHLIDIVI